VLIHSNAFARIDQVSARNSTIRFDHTGQTFFEFCHNKLPSCSAYLKLKLRRGLLWGRAMTIRDLLNFGRYAPTLQPLQAAKWLNLLPAIHPVLCRTSACLESL